MSKVINNKETINRRRFVKMSAWAAAIWMNTLTWCKNHPGETPPFFKPDESGVMKALNNVTRNEILCRKIAGHSFETINDHTSFIQNGGCDKLIQALSTAG